MIRRLLVAAMAGALLLAGCGGGGDGEPDVASLDKGADRGDATAAAGGGSTDVEQSLLDFSECMRREGLDDFPDLTAGSGFQQLIDSGIDVRSKAFQDALEGCRDLLEGVFNLDRLSPEQQAETQDLILRIARCLRDRGYDVPEPDFSKGLGVEAFGDLSELDVDTNDPAFRADLRACFSDAGLPGAGGNGASGSSVPAGDG